MLFFVEICNKIIIANFDFFWFNIQKQCLKYTVYYIKRKRIYEKNIGCYK